MADLPDSKKPEDASRLEARVMTAVFLQTARHPLPDINLRPTDPAQLQAYWDRLSPEVQAMALEIIPPPKRPPEKLSDRNRQMLIRWVKDGEPELTALVCDRYAEQFFLRRFKRTKAGSPARLKIHECIRVAIRRYRSVAGQL
jgi:hypothetical protein